MITIVCSITKPEQFLYRLGRSLISQKTDYVLRLTDPALPLAVSYNTVKRIKTEYIMFVHQDVWFNPLFLQQIEEHANKISDFGVGGVIGWKKGGRSVGGLWRTKAYFKDYKGEVLEKVRGKGIIPYKTKLRGRLCNKTEEVFIIDDMVYLIKSDIWNKRKFDEKFRFHGVGEDYCLQVIEMGKGVYVLPVTISTIPSGRRFDNDSYGSINNAKKMLLDKWGHKYKSFKTCLGTVGRVKLSQREYNDGCPNIDTKMVELRKRLKR